MADHAGDGAAPVSALRDAFGDPKPPNISRKITACVACRKQKIKCHMRDSQPPCTRCRKRGLSCTVNRSLQMLMENDALWKHSMETKIKKLDEAMRKINNNSSVPLEAAQSEHGNDEAGVASLANGEAVVDGQAQRESLRGQGYPEEGQIKHWQIVMDLDSGPGAIPGFYISQTPSARPVSGTSGDIISCGIVTPQNAQIYLDRYQNRLDHFPYKILGNHSSSTLDEIRKASPLLIAAICTVSALHLSSDDFNSCYKHFVSLSAMQSFSKQNTIDEVRAFCIGAFWLSDLSWTLVGAAVRIATELQLHRSIFKALQGDRKHYFRTRLYLLVYACDHQFSVPFGRPPMTRECETVKNARKLLDCEYATEDDARLVSQVLRWSLCSNIYDSFGVNIDKPISESEIPQLQQFSIALDTLRVEWAHRFSPNAHVGNYPKKGVGLQYHFAKLYLFSHIFRGATSSGRLQSESGNTAIEQDEIAHLAILSALSIVRTVVSDTEIQSHLDGLPIYFDTMIAFAVVFLLKSSSFKFSGSPRLDTQEIQTLIHALVVTLKRVTSTMHPQHLLVSITSGIDSLLQVYYPPTMDDQTEQAVPNLEMLGNNVSWTAEEAPDAFFMGEYDFLLNQDLGFNVDLELASQPSSSP